MITYPALEDAEQLKPGVKRVLIAAYGFEDRSLGWVRSQKQQQGILTDAILFRYKRSRAKNRVVELNRALSELGVTTPREIHYDLGARFPGNVEDNIEEEFENYYPQAEEFVVDISAMSKLLILISLCKLSKFEGKVRIIYSEAEDYAPTEEDFMKSGPSMEFMTRFPSRGVESIVRTRCLSSIRMQGQPVSLIAFTSFNEQLVRHMLGTINPHRLIFINGRPPRQDYAWRERATHEIHKQLIEEYIKDNPSDETGLLTRSVSTLDYRETIECIDSIYKLFGEYERLICAATGSKMQTVGLFFSKVAHPDIHIEYPTPNSYFVKGMSKRVRSTQQIEIPHFASFLKEVRSGSVKVRL
jgi:hypothetical protein